MAAPQISVLNNSEGARVETLITTRVEGDQHIHQWSPEPTLSDLLQPITDASHTRNRKQSPPDSACLPGTRKTVIKSITSWASSSVLIKRRHVLWLYGYAGCGKSAIAQEVCRQVQGGLRMLASFFFYRNAGDRSTIGRLPNTLANQMATTIPKTEGLIKAAIKAGPDLLRADSGLSLTARIERLVYDPLRVVSEGSVLAKWSLSTPYLIVIDGLDECEDKEGVEEFLDCTLNFFKQHPQIPLRILITSRIEQHIRHRLQVDTVLLKNLADHCSDNDIAAFADVVFHDAIQASPIIQAYIRENGAWPSPPDQHKLVEHIGGSFIFASTLFKFIFNPSSPDDHSTPMGRLPLALNISPGLDALYWQTLSRSVHHPHFSNIISTLTLLVEPLPITGIAELLELKVFEVLQVLLDLQAIIQVPGTDDAPVTFCHTSLRDFLTSESRSGSFSAPPSFHSHLYLYCLRCELRARQATPQAELLQGQPTAAVRYSLKYREARHWNPSKRFFGVAGLGEIVRLHREMLEVHPDRAIVLSHLGTVFYTLAKRDRSPSDHIKVAISTYHEALALCASPPSNPSRYPLLTNLGHALIMLFEQTSDVADIEKAIVMFREALDLRPPPAPDRPVSLSNLAGAIDTQFRHNGLLPHLDEVISLHREALDLRPHPHPDRHLSLNNLGTALYTRYEKTPQALQDLDEAVSLMRECLACLPEFGIHRQGALTNISVALRSLYEQKRSLDDLEEAISHSRELVTEYYPIGFEERNQGLVELATQLQLRFEVTRNQADLDEIHQLWGEVEEGV